MDSSMALVRYFENASSYLSHGIPYSLNRKLISHYFETTKITDDKTLNNFDYRVEKITGRLYLLDGMYSTNMSKRLYGIHDLACSIAGFTDRELIEITQDFCVSNPNQRWKSTISELLCKNTYGTSKNIETSQKSTSLVSKYLYFLSSFSFPIYDSLVRDELKHFLRLVPNRKLLNTTMSFFDEILYFSEYLKLDSSSIDNGIWFYGKLQKGSISLLVDKSKYVSILKYLKKDYCCLESEDVDKQIRKLLFNPDEDNFLKDLLGLEFFEIIEFARNLKLLKSNS